MNSGREIQFRKTNEGQWIYVTEREVVFVYKEKLVDKK